MSEYTAIMIGVGGIMYMLLYMCFQLSPNYDPLKVFFISIFFIWGYVFLNVAKQVAMAASAPTGLQNAVDYAMYVWMVITGIALVYILIYIIPDTYRAMKEAAKSNSAKRNFYDDKQ